MKNGKIDHALLDEYGLNEVTFKLLRLASKSPITWGGPGLSAINKQPAPSLRKLVGRGLLDGPGREEKITARPFSLTEPGREILARIERGLRTNGFMSAGKVKVLELLEQGFASPQFLLANGAHQMSLLSVKDAGYIDYSPSERYGLTDLGREALEQWRLENPLAQEQPNEKPGA